MSTSTSSSSSMYQELVGDFYSRRLLLHTPLYNSPATASPPAAATAATVDGDNSFDANVVMVLSVLLCALICSLGLNSIIRCALRCSTFLASQSGDSSISARLATTGIKKKALKTFPTLTYSVGLSLPGLDTECVICLSEFTAGERLRILPKCNHGFHLRCIDKWLGSHSSCPTCRHCLIETCQKIVGCCSSQVASTSEPSPSPPSSPPPPPPPQENIVVSIITPLEPEGLIRNYRGVN